jgi:microcystin-dependent protein
MPRNGSGTFVLPEAAFVPGTAISSPAMNSDLSDIADGITDSLARDGQGGMTAVLPLANTGFTYLTDPNTGMRRTGADTQAISGGGVDVITVTPTGASVTGTLAVSGALTVGGAALLQIGMSMRWLGTTAPSKWLLERGQTLLRADYPDLWTFASAEIALGNTLFTNGNGSTTFTIPDSTGRVGAGREAVATRLTSTYFGGNSTILGATGGLESNTLAAVQIPTITAGASNSITVTSPGGTIVTAVGLTSSNAGAGPHGGVDGVGYSGTITSTGTNTINVTSNNTTGAAHNNVQPTIIVNYIIFAGV